MTSKPKVESSTEMGRHRPTVLQRRSGVSWRLLFVCPTVHWPTAVDGAAAPVRRRQIPAERSPCLVMVDKFRESPRGDRRCCASVSLCFWKNYNNNNNGNSNSFCMRQAQRDSCVFVCVVVYFLCFDPSKGLLEPQLDDSPSLSIREHFSRWLGA